MFGDYKPSEQRLLDDLDDARHEHARVRRWTNVALGFAVFGIALTMGGVAAGIISSFNELDLGDLCAAMITPGILIAVTSGAALAVWVVYDDGDATREMRRAERAYRDHVMQQDQ